MSHLVANLARFLLITVFTLQVVYLGEVWYWSVLTLVIGALAVEWLRAEQRRGGDGLGQLDGGGDHQDHRHHGERQGDLG